MSNIPVLKFKKIESILLDMGFKEARQSEWDSKTNLD